MLASPMYPPTQPNFSPKDSEHGQYRPTKDLEAFNKLLPPPIEFVEGSSSGTLAVAEGRYEPINPTQQASTSKVEPSSKVSSATPSTPNPIPSNIRSDTPTSSPAKTPIKTPAKTPSKTLYHGDIELGWPGKATLGSGLYNNGNTCFLNSALQCLLHTPPLLHILSAHKDCKSRGPFCMICNLRSVAAQSFKSPSPFSPHLITSKLQLIAKHMRRGRQEDSHEFLRYAIDALQRSCLAGYPPKLEHKLTETTWVHKVFGGRLRSRVTCRDCGYNSDTFDSILDLSLDIHHAQHLNGALRKFVAPDYLKGADKYKCEKCKKHVNAEKRFTIHDAPAVLTVHLKRFSPMGHKIGHGVDYDEQLSLEPYMSEGQFGPRYTLYGVICHAGGGPNSGHYFAFVKSRENKWFEMNDESVEALGSPPVRLKNAYILFYLKNKGQKLDSITFSSAQRQKSGLVAAMKKRTREDAEDEDPGEKVAKPFIGPLLPPSNGDASPSDAKRPRLDTSDPQADKLKRKIQSVSAQAGLAGLADYTSDDEPPGEESSKPSPLARPQPSPTIPSSTTPKSSAIPPAAFYGNPASSKKRHGPANGNRHDSWKKNHFNPYNRMGSGKKKGTARGL
ncbi:hypothetical protein V5O48_001934 [Marasmius crinis-equi]|uniref:Ubiquitin carboxyl-terminal hydrolase n=1 Tax=Marasmius crinis-equi TaxID=585013 RepID=A0ABR3FXF2_9AGAR